MRRALVFLFICSCTGAIGMKPAAIEPKAPVRHEGALTAGTVAASSTVPATDAPQSLSLLHGTLAVAGDQTLYTLDGTTLHALPVGDTGESMTLGHVRAVSPRGEGLFLLTEAGIFHDASGRLLRSPMSDSLPHADVKVLDDVGEATEEEVWLTTTQGIERAKAGLLTKVELTFDGVTSLDLAIAVEKNRALLLANGNLFSVDLGDETAVWEAKDLPTVNAVARGDDGTIFLATQSGLYQRNKAGELSVTTFAAAGESAKNVSDVSSQFGETLIAVEGQAAVLNTTSATTFGPLVTPRAHGLTRDANGDTYALDGASLIKLATGRVISFETDVKPFLAAHCTSCHTTGANYSPVFDLTDFATAKTYAALMVKRLTARGVSPMPPTTTEVLTSSDYAVVLRWVAGGEQP